MPSNLNNQKVLVMGFGLHGGGAALVSWLVSQRARVTVTDLKSQSELAVSLGRLPTRVRQQVRWVLGRHRPADFKAADMVVQNPAVSRQSAYLKIARQAGVMIENDASLFFKHCPAPIIGVTGTRGKSTTATLLAKLLGQSRSRRVWLVGLPQQTEFMALSKIRATDLVVIELSSWQLEGLADHRLGPAGAVLTNLYADHLNRYATMISYGRAKQNIFTFQTADDFAVVNRDQPATRRLARAVLAQRFWFSKKYFADENGTYIKNKTIIFRHNGREKKLAQLADIHLAGEHNLENVLAAVTAAAVNGVVSSSIRSALRSFTGLAHRIELIKTVNGVAYYNDTTATSPDATIAALKTLPSRGKNIILIAGGADKKIPLKHFKPLQQLIKQKCKAVLLLTGEGSNKIKFSRRHLVGVSTIVSMTDAVGIAARLAGPGDLVLLSPACASFGLFINEYDRGRQFNQAVKQL